MSNCLLCKKCKRNSYLLHAVAQLICLGPSYQAFSFTVERKWWQNDCLTRLSAEFATPLAGNRKIFFQSFCKCQVWKKDSSLPRWYRRWEGRLHPCLKAIYFDIMDPHFLNVVSCRVVVRTAVVKRRLLFPSVVFLFAGMVMHRTKQASLMTDMSLI